jgi:isochorismate pyruvate lyase
VQGQGDFLRAGGAVRRPEDCASLEDVRRGIDALDREIVALIGERSRYVEAAAKFKTDEAGVRAPERQRAMLEERRRWAEEEGLSPDVIEDLFRRLVSYFINREMGHWEGGGHERR